MVQDFTPIAGQAWHRGERFDHLRPSTREAVANSLAAAHSSIVKTRAMMARLQRQADAEQAKSTGGMVALYPRTDYALQLQVPGGEPVQDLHVTLAYLGEDVTGSDPGGISQGLDQICSSYTVIDARVMGHATFNGDGGPDGDMDPCAVYLISDSEQMTSLHQDVLDLCTQQFNLPQQHMPWIPHLTAGYGVDQGQLDYHGTILFDRIGFKFAGNSRTFPLLGSTSTEDIG